jgi:Sulfotransferase family
MTDSAAPDQTAAASSERSDGGERAPIFVVGVARSGTTLLAALLSGHPRLDAGPESRFFARLRHLDAVAQARLTDPATWPDPAVEFLASLANQGHPVIGLFDLTVDDVRTWLAARPPSIAAMLEGLTVQHAARRGKARWVEKTPRHLLEIAAIRRSWPDAYIVRIVRDPRDVALSLAAMPFAGGTLVSNLVRIDTDDRASRDHFRSDSRSLTLRYEDLVTEPERELRRVCEMVGEAFDPAMLDPRPAAEAVAGEHEWWKGGVSGPLDASRVGRWRREMPAAERRFAGVHLAALLREHGYEDARTAEGSVAIVPVGSAVGPGNDGILLELARRYIEVVRPTPADVAALDAADEVVFVGVRGQLDPFREMTGSAHTAALFRLASVLVRRRLRRAPVHWYDTTTSWPSLRRAPSEVATLLLVRTLARRARIDT